jgi:DNA polymerase
MMTDPLALPEDDAPAVTTLAALRAAEGACRRCPLYRQATQVVPGEGPRAAELMLVGEQPGDREDLAGRPFVGPAGLLLDRALADAGISRKSVFVTNAVKHFKHELRGKRRLHKRPTAYEIDRCRWWLDRELAIVKPEVVVALGATAARGLFGRPLAIGTSRGRPMRLDDGTPAVVTIHPSALLRIREQADRRREYVLLVADLRRAATSSERRSG